MSNYVFLPVPSVEMLSSANSLELHWKTATLRNPYLSGWKKGFVRRIGSGCLKALTPEDTLFILIHQYYGKVAASRHADLERNKKGEWEHHDEELKEYTGDAMARVLESEGLPKGFKNLYVAACNSALRHPDAVRPFGKDLLRAVKLRGYAAAEVTGFKGYFRPGAPGVFVQAGEDLINLPNPDRIKLDNQAAIETFS